MFDVDQFQFWAPLRPKPATHQTQTQRRKVKMTKNKSLILGTAIMAVLITITFGFVPEAQAQYSNTCCPDCVYLKGKRKTTCDGECTHKSPPCPPKTPPTPTATTTEPPTPPPPATTTEPPTPPPPATTGKRPTPPPPIPPEDNPCAKDDPNKVPDDEGVCKCRDGFEECPCGGLCYQKCDPETQYRDTDCQCKEKCDGNDVKPDCSTCADDISDGTMTKLKVWFEQLFQEQFQPRLDELDAAIAAIGTGVKLLWYIAVVVTLCFLFLIYLVRCKYQERKKMKEAEARKGGRRQQTTQTTTSSATATTDPPQKDPPLPAGPA